MRIKHALLLPLLFSVSSIANEQRQSVESLQAEIHHLENFQLIDINSANVQELARLPGIGEKKAQAIVAYRNKHGKFIDLGALSSVKGIGQGILLKLDGRIRF